MQLHESLKTARIKYKDKIDLDIFKQFINADKSKSYKYVEKMCEIFHNYNITYLNVIKIFSDYQKLENYISNKALTNMSLEDILDTIDEAEIIKETSKSLRKRRIKSNSLIYNNKGIKIYHIRNFQDSFELGKGTQWCTSLDKNNYNLYDKEYDMFIIVNMNYDLEHPFRKICYLISDNNEMIVDKNNIHYFSDNSKDYNKIKALLIPIKL